MSAAFPVSAVPAGDAIIRYRVSPADPDAHLFVVELVIAQAASANGTLLLELPAWLPGSYMIRDFARNILQVSATQASGGALTVDKTDKQTWRLTGIDSTVTVRYEVYAWELSVRSAHLDRTHGYFNGACLFLRVHGQEHQPCQVDLLPPPARGARDDDWTRDWRVATSLRRAGAAPWGFGPYRADDYADLIDHPVELGRFELLEFAVQGVPHALAVTGRHHGDLVRLITDLPRVCTEHAALFGALPIDRYLFLLTVVGNGYGGLEHAYSTSLLANRSDLPPIAGTEAARTTVETSDAATASAATTGAETTASGAAGKVPGDGYRRLLGLCSHEYFHLWHVKRIQPLAFAEQRLDREVHTRLLWAFEGITSYYDDLALVRCGLIDTQAYLTLLAETITRVLRNPGRARQTVAESSFDAWTRFYKQDENAPNAIVSYYTKGALVALALDLTLRRDSGGRHCLDDLMRALWHEHGSTGVGVGERAIEALAGRLTGLDLDGFFTRAVDGTEDLALADLLGTVGVGLRLRPARGPSDQGGVFEPGSAAPAAVRADLGIRLQPEAREAQLAVVLVDRPAQRAGLAAGDTIIAVDGLRVDAANLDSTLARLPLGRQVPLHAFRRDELMRFQVTLAAAPADTCELGLLSDATPAALAVRADWLRSRQP